MGQADAGESLIIMLCGVDMCEVFSPPRVGLEARKFGLTAGDALDLTTGWDFNIEQHRRDAEAYVDKEEPLVLIWESALCGVWPASVTQPRK